jgi:hypothetical protein
MASFFQCFLGALSLATFDHIPSGLQGELQNSKDTSAELSNLTGIINEIGDVLGGNAVRALQQIERDPNFEWPQNHVSFPIAPLSGHSLSNRPTILPYPSHLLRTQHVPSAET